MERGDFTPRAAISPKELEGFIYAKTFPGVRAGDVPVGAPWEGFQMSRRRRRRRRDVPRAHLGQAQVDFGRLQNSLSSLTHFCHSQGPKKKEKNPRNSFLAPQKKNPGRTERKPEAAEEREMFSNILWIIIILKYFVTIPVVKFLQHGLSACSALSLQDPGLLKGR